MVLKIEKAAKPESLPGVPRTPARPGVRQGAQEGGPKPAGQDAPRGRSAGGACLLIALVQATFQDK